MAETQSYIQRNIRIAASFGEGFVDKKKKARLFGLARNAQEQQVSGTAFHADGEAKQAHAEKGESRRLGCCSDVAVDGRTGTTID